MISIVKVAYTSPTNNPVKYHFICYWKSIRKDVASAQNVAFNDSA